MPGAVTPFRPTEDDWSNAGLLGLKPPALSQPRHIPKRPGEPDYTWADISKVTTELSWKPEISFEEGISKMVSEIDHWQDAPLWDPDSIKEATKTWFKYMNNVISYIT